MDVHKRFRIAAYPIVSLILACGGCGGAGGYGEGVSIPQTRQQQLSGAASESVTLSFPTNAEFNVTEAQRHSTGDGRSESFARPDGTAQCQASIDGKGTAWGEFQVGHIIKNDTTKPIETDIRFDCEYEYAVNAKGNGTFHPEMIGLKMYIQDSNRHVLKRVPLVSNDSPLGASEQSGQQSPTFHLTMEPGLAYQFILAGRVEVSADDSAQDIEARIEVKSFSIEVHQH